MTTTPRHVRGHAGRNRHARSAILVAALVFMPGACDSAQPPPTDAGVDAASLLPPAPIGGGYCCPIDSPTCDCFRNGGWVDVDDPTACPRICDLGPQGARISPDGHGCDRLTSPSSCL